MAFPTIAEAFGSESATGVAKETTFGQPVAATTFLPMTGNGMESEPGWFSPTLMMGTRDKQVFNLYGEQSNVGAVEGALFPSNALEIIVAAIGTDVVTGTGAPYTHTISQAAGLLASLTVEKNIGGRQSLQFAGGRVGKLSIKAPTGNEPVSFSADMTAQSVAILTSPTAISVTNELPYTFAESTLTLFSNARAEVTNCTIDIDNGLKVTHTWSANHGPSFITPVSLTVSGTIELVWSSLNNGTYGDFSNMQNGTLGALSVGFAHPGGGGYGITFDMPQVALSKVAEDIKFDDVVMSTLTFQASKPLTGGSQFTVGAVASNAVSTAY
jgi:hypothetical protein